jgi:hypothetical protein
MPLHRTGKVLVAGATGPTANGFAVPFKREEFVKLIETHGYDVTWEKAAFCPYLKGPDPRAHDINCSACHAGFIYFESSTTRVVMSSLNISQQYFAYGRFDSGRAQITAFPEMKMSFWDRITLCNSRARFSELVKRQRTTLSDKFRYTPICVSYVAWPDANGDLATAVENTDFTVQDDGILWTTTNRPGADTHYTVVYFYRPIYIVTDVPHQVRDLNVTSGRGVAQQEFPVQVIGQLDQFVRDEGKDLSHESEGQNPFPTTPTSRWTGA